MDKLKIVSIVGARPNFVKLFPVHLTINKISEHTIIHTGQHYDFEMSEIFFNEFDLPAPTYNLEIGPGLQGSQAGEMIKKIESILVSNDFDICLVYGDTTSTFAGAFAANKSNLRLAHIEAGLRSFDRRMPEEINRILTDEISDLLFAPTRTAVTNLLTNKVFGEVVNSGDLSVEIIRGSLSKIKKSKILDKLGLEKNSYLLFTMHRAENTFQNSEFLSVLKAIEKINDKMIVFPIHPRTRRFLIENNLYQKIVSLKNVKLISPTGYVDFLCLTQNSTKVLTDSGGIQKEAFILNVPCITLRNTTEWVETVEVGWNVLVGTNTEKILKYVDDWHPTGKPTEHIFGNGKTSQVIANKIINFLN